MSMLRAVGDVTNVDPLGSLLTFGPLGIMVVLILTGYLITKKHADDLRTETTTWRSAYEHERDARRAEHDARLRAEAVAAQSLEQGRILVGLMQKVQDRLDSERR